VKSHTAENLQPIPLFKPHKKQPVQPVNNNIRNKNKVRENNIKNVNRVNITNQSQIKNLPKVTENGTPSSPSPIGLALAHIQTYITDTHTTDKETQTPQDNTVNITSKLLHDVAGALSKNTDSCNTQKEQFTSMNEPKEVCLFPSGLTTRKSQKIQTEQIEINIIEAITSSGESENEEDELSSEEDIPNHNTEETFDNIPKLGRSLFEDAIYDQITKHSVETNTRQQIPFTKNSQTSQITINQKYKPIINNWNKQRQYETRQNNTIKSRVFNRINHTNTTEPTYTRIPEKTTNNKNTFNNISDRRTQPQRSYNGNKTQPQRSYNGNKTFLATAMTEEISPRMKPQMSHNSDNIFPAMAKTVDKTSLATVKTEKIEDRTQSQVSYNGNPTKKVLPGTTPQVSYNGNPTKKVSYNGNPTKKRWPGTTQQRFHKPNTMERVRPKPTPQDPYMSNPMERVFLRTRSLESLGSYNNDTIGKFKQKKSYGPYQTKENFLTFPNTEKQQNKTQHNQTGKRLIPSKTSNTQKQESDRIKIHINQITTTKFKMKRREKTNPEDKTKQNKIQNDIHKSNREIGKETHKQRREQQTKHKARVRIQRPKNRIRNYLISLFLLSILILITWTTNELNLIQIGLEIIILSSLMYFIQRDTDKTFIPKESPHKLMLKKTKALEGQIIRQNYEARIQVLATNRRRKQRQTNTTMEFAPSYCETPHITSEDETTGIITLGTEHEQEGFEADSLYTEVFLSTSTGTEIKQWMLVDPAAQATIISTDILEELENAKIISHYQIDLKPAGGANMPVDSIRRIKLRLGNVAIWHNVVVTTIPNKCILGLDVLKKAQISLINEGTNYALTMKHPYGEIIPLKCLHSATAIIGRDMMLRPGVNLIETYLVDASINRIEASSIRTLPVGPLLIEGDSSLLHSPLHIPNTITKREKNKAIIYIVNKASHDVPLYRNAVVATLSAIPNGDIIISESQIEQGTSIGNTIELKESEEIKIHYQPDSLADDELEPAGFDIPPETESQYKNKEEMESMIKEQLKKTDFPQEFLENFVSFLTSEVNGLISQHEFDFGTLNLEKYNFPFDILLSNEEQIKLKPYILNSIRADQLKSALGRLVTAGILERSADGDVNASPIFMVPKQDGRIRIVFDVRILNKNSLKSSYPLPRMNHLLQEASHQRYYSSLDCRSAYSTIPMTEKAQKLCGVISQDAQYKVKRMMFGLSSSPNHFSAVIAKVIQGLKGVFCYLDDILIVATTKSEHYQRIKQACLRLHEAGFKIQLSKTDFFKKQLKFLGKMLDASGVQPLPRHIEAIQKYDKPVTKKALQRFLGLCAWVCIFLPHYSKKIAPMADLLCQQSTKLVWNNIATAAFHDIKLQLTSTMKNYHVCYSSPVYLNADAAYDAWGGVLYQIQTYTLEDLPALREALQETGNPLEPAPSKEALRRRQVPVCHPILPPKGKQTPGLFILETGKQEAQINTQMFEMPKDMPQQTQTDMPFQSYAPKHFDECAEMVARTRRTLGKIERNFQGRSKEITEGIFEDKTTLIPSPDELISPDNLPSPPSSPQDQNPKTQESQPTPKLPTQSQEQQDRQTPETISKQSRQTQQPQKDKLPNESPSLETPLPQRIKEKIQKRKNREELNQPQPPPTSPPQEQTTIRQEETQVRGQEETPIEGTSESEDEPDNELTSRENEQRNEWLEDFRSKFKAYLNEPRQGRNGTSETKEQSQNNQKLPQITEDDENIIHESSSESENSDDETIRKKLFQRNEEIQNQPTEDHRVYKGKRTPSQMEIDSEPKDNKDKLIWKGKTPDTTKDANTFSQSNTEQMQDIDENIHQNIEQLEDTHEEIQQIERHIESREDIPQEIEPNEEQIEILEEATQNIRTRRGHKI